MRKYTTPLGVFFFTLGVALSVFLFAPKAHAVAVDPVIDPVVVPHVDDPVEAPASGGAHDESPPAPPRVVDGEDEPNGAVVVINPTPIWITQHHASCQTNQKGDNVCSYEPSSFNWWWVIIPILIVLGIIFAVLMTMP